VIGRIAALAACTIVVIGVVLAFGVIGSPAHARLLALDQRRVDDLDAIVQAIGDDGTSKAPARLADIRAVSVGTSFNDPVTGKPYEYHRETAHRYELCAVFTLPTDPGDSGRWKHPAGRACRRYDD
jgi:hypothetical protein